MSSLPAAANPLDAWGPAVGAGVLAVNPNLYVGGTGTVEPQLILTQGLHDRVDVTLAGALTWPGPDGSVELLPRYFPVEQIGLVLHIVVNQDGIALGPEVHSTVLVDRFGVYIDAGWLPRVAGRGEPGLAFLVAGVEARAIGRLWGFLETNTEVALPANALSNHVTPGVYATLDDAGNSELCVGVRLPTTAPLAESTLGLWWNQNVAVGRRR